MRGSLCGRRKKRREGEESAKEKRESNRPRFFSSSKSPAPLMPTLRALYESKKRKGFLSFRFLNRETLETRLGTTTSLPLTSGDIQKKYVRHIRSWLPSHSKRKEKKDGGVFSLCSWSPVIPNFHEKQSSG